MEPLTDKERSALLRDVQRYVRAHYVPPGETPFLDAPIFGGAASAADALGSLHSLRRGTPSGAVKEAILQSIQHLLKPSFHDHLLKLIEKKGLKNAELYQRADITKALFSKIKNSADYHPSKETVIALALGLKLTLDETKAFLESAGYALTDSSKTDLIVRFFLQRHIYDVSELNNILYEMHLPPITNRKETRERKAGW